MKKKGTKMRILQTSAMALALAFSALSFGSAANATEPNSCTGNACVAPASISAVAVAGFNGQIIGGFGALDGEGNLVAGQGITGEVKGWKEGGGSTLVDIQYSGEGCGLDCGDTNVTLKAAAYEKGGMSVKVMGSGSGQMVGAINSGSFASTAGIAIQKSGGSN